MSSDGGGQHLFVNNNEGCEREKIERGMNLVESIKSKVRSLKLKKGKKPYVKMDKSASVKVEIRSRKARKLIEKTLKAADAHTH
ncbi:hypothetical protein VNO80_08482 [Phaseolus coccineus]|uniref:Uncharacterized protein n=1 Tax=Phaseolus coccineus TaxID=3886 RepID=A0AAN9N6C5_PHACN